MIMPSLYYAVNFSKYIDKDKGGMVKEFKSNAPDKFKDEYYNIKT
ncbi:MAG: hypothetical protein ACK5LT_07075 [Lachnospirales bacterium]